MASARLFQVSNFSSSDISLSLISYQQSRRPSNQAKFPSYHQRKTSATSFFFFSYYQCNYPFFTKAPLFSYPTTNQNDGNQDTMMMNQELSFVRCQCFDLYDQLVPYKEAWTWQKTLVEEKQTLIDRNQDCPDTVILLQHSPVYTMGTGSSEDYLKFDVKDAPFDVYRTQRGGEVTYHGPGQVDLHWYLRTLEEVVIRVLSSAFSIRASRLDGLTGVWVGNQKVAAIGIRVSKWITYHGLALNVTTDLAPFDSIVPCGIRDRRVGSVKGLLEDGKVGDLRLIDVAHESLLKEFSEVFQLQLEKQTVSDPTVHNAESFKCLE